MFPPDFGVVLYSAYITFYIARSIINKEELAERAIFSRRCEA
jgi:hypothetical protein